MLQSQSTLENFALQKINEAPRISDYSDVALYIKARLQFLKKNNSHFSVLQATRKLRKISPALISLIIRGKRNLTIDRVDEMTKLLRLNSSERIQFKDWVYQKNFPETHIHKTKSDLFSSTFTKSSSRKTVPVHLLNDWLNAYVKDCFQIEGVSENPQLIFELLTRIAPKSRIQKSLEFLLREGYLRKTPDGKIVLESHLAVPEGSQHNPPQNKIRQFHKAALKVAQAGIETFSPSERLANSVLLTLNEDSYAELVNLLEECSEKIQRFIVEHQENGNRLYQLILNLSPTGERR